MQESDSPEFQVPKPDEPPLHRAAREGNRAAIHELIAAGADPNATYDLEPDPEAGERHATPLMTAAGSGTGATVETVRLLLELGADPRLVVGGESAASFACEGLGWHYGPGGDAGRLALLLDAGSPLKLTGRDGGRFFCAVSKQGDPERLKVLLAHGASPNALWDPEEAKRDAAAMRRYLTSNSQGCNGDATDATEAPDSESERSFHDFLEQQAKEDEERNASAPWSHEIPLHCAAESGSAECVRLLLEAGADLHARDNSRQTAMYAAASKEVVLLLKERGLPVEDSDYMDWSPMLHALCAGDDAVTRVRALLAAGADVNATHDRGYTLFMSAVGSERRPELLRLLVEAGADVHAVSELGYNAFHAAIDVNWGANAEESVRATLRYLKELGVNMELRNRAGQTPLARAIQDGTGVEVRVLCELGANANAVCALRRCGEDGCEHQELPLLFHAVDGTGVHKDVKTEALLRAGADPLALTPEGHSALALAVADLCRHADDYAGAFSAFFLGLHGLRVPEGASPADQEAYAAMARPVVREYVRSFAAPIPLGTSCEYEGQWREERLVTIELLGAYEGWARQRRLRERAAP